MLLLSHPILDALSIDATFITAPSIFLLEIYYLSDPSIVGFNTMIHNRVLSNGGKPQLYCHLDNIHARRKSENLTSTDTHSNTMKADKESS